MRIPLALLKGAILGLVLIGAVYFLQECYGPIADTLTHIPDIIFRGYTPQTLDESCSVMFFSWITVEGILLLPQRLHGLPHRRPAYPQRSAHSLAGAGSIPRLQQRQHLIPQHSAASFRFFVSYQRNRVLSTYRK